MKTKIKNLFQNIKKSPKVAKNALCLCLALMVMSVSTFAWFTLGGGNVDVGDGSVIQYPNGVAIGFENNGSAIEASIIKIDDILPRNFADLSVRIKKPAETEIRFSLKFGSYDCFPVERVKIFELFYIRHDITETRFNHTMADVLNERGGYFLNNFVAPIGAAEIIYKFQVYFSDIIPDDWTDTLNDFQGVAVTINQMELEIIHKGV